MKKDFNFLKKQFSSNITERAAKADMKKINIKETTRTTIS